MPTFIGTDANNKLHGTALADLLDGRKGADEMTGGDGNDTYIVDNVSDKVIELAGQGHDTVYSSVTYTLAAEVEDLHLTGTAKINGTGNALDNTIIGNDGDNIINGGAGADTMIGGKGWDVYYVDDVGDSVIEAAIPGDVDVVESSVSMLHLYNNVENLALTGGDDLIAIGNNLDNVIIGNAGANYIDGGVGADKMSGGAGNDIYYVDNAKDIVDEHAGGGTDIVYSLVSHNLEANVEALTLLGSANINGGGNALDNILTGNSGNNTLSGGAGTDTMIGGAGDDNYFVENAGDKVVENAGEGTDTIYSSIDYSLSNAQNVEILHLIANGPSGLHGSGNELNNTIVGTVGSDVIDGGIGADSMIGGGGDDTYYVDNVGDIVVEGTFQGAHDTIISSIALTQATENVENYEFHTTQSVTFQGTLYDDHIVGGSGADELNGGDGKDTIHGGAGDDLMLLGNGGDDILFGDAGADTMAGDSGNDIYYVDNVKDVIIGESYLTGSGTDLVYTSVDYTLPDYVENGSVIGTGNVRLDGSLINNVLMGNDSNNTLDGHAGSDILVGGKGSDTFEFHMEREAATQTADTDTIKDFVKTEDVLQFDHVQDHNGDGAITLDDLLASVSKVEDHGVGKDVSVTLDNGNSITFAGAGTGAVQHITDLVAHPDTQIHVS